MAGEGPGVIHKMADDGRPQGSREMKDPSEEKTQDQVQMKIPKITMKRCKENGGDEKRSGRSHGGRKGALAKPSEIDLFTKRWNEA